MNSSCAKSHMSLPLPVHTLRRVLTLRTSLYIHIYRYTHKYTYFILQILLCMTPCCANSHMSVPLRVLTVRTSLYTYICSQIYIFHITDTFVYDSVLCEQCELTYVCALASAHSQNLLCIHRYTHKYTYFILQILLYVNPCCANSHMSVPLRVLTVRTSLYTCIYSEVYIYHITNTFICEPMLCELTYVCALASAHS